MQKPITQEDPYGCGAACVAFYLNLPYADVVDQMGTTAARSRGYGCQKLVSILNKNKGTYRFKKYRPTDEKLLLQDSTIVFIARSPSYPAGHYLIRYHNQWMDPWINLPKDRDITHSTSGFRNTLPGDPQWLIYQM